MNRRHFLVTTSVATLGFPAVLTAVSQSSQEFIWNEIVPIAQRFDPKYVTLMPRGFWYDTQPKEWMDYIAEKTAKGEWCCLSSCWQDLKVPVEIGEAHTNLVTYCKEKGKYFSEEWNWDYFKRNLFTPARKNIVWDSMLLNLQSSGMSFSTYDKDGWVCKQVGHYIPNAFERGEQVGILLSPESHYKGWANCKMWYEFV